MTTPRTLLSATKNAVMLDQKASTMDRRCTVCGCSELIPFVRRSDGVQVLRCMRCCMGVIETIPDDLMALYGDDYYGAGEPTRDGKAGTRYEDYRYTAEHGVAWAAALVKLLRPAGGRVLDIGCADGHLLAKLGSAYALSGIEANDRMGNIVAERGVAMLGRDLLDPVLVERHAGTFDVITAIAVFEHLRDFRAGMQAALTLLRNDGVLLFEVPLMSAVHDNTTWLTSSLEHVWYPSQKGLQQLVNAELGARMVGTELFITGYASTYVGLVFRDEADDQMILDIVSRVVLREAKPVSVEEATARMLLHLVHAASVTPADVALLATLPADALNPQLLRRFAELWQVDLSRLERTQAESQRVQMAWEQEVAHARRLKAELDVAESDRIRSHTELTTGIVAAQARLAAVVADLDAKILAEVALGQQKADLARDRAELDAAAAKLATTQKDTDAALAAATKAERQAIERQAVVDAELAGARAALDQEWAAVRAMQAGAAWRVAAILREAARRYPRIARSARRVARVLWWTVRGRLIRQLRLRQKARAQLRAREAAFSVQPAPLPQLLPPVSAVASNLAAPSSTQAESAKAASAFSQPWPPASQPALGRKLALLDVTGHRPPLRRIKPHQAGDWPLVSVVVTSFNYGRFVADAVDSALAQTFRDLEVIVVEGGSSNPDSRYAVAGLRRPRTRVLMQGLGHRAGANRNFGISQARGQYVCCLDADDTLAPTYIEKAVYMMERHGYDVVSSAMEMVGDAQGQINIQEQPDLGALLDSNQVLTCAVFRRSLWEQAGGYRDTDPVVTGIVYEDWAFWVRLAALGARFRNLQHDPMMRYRVHGASLSHGKDVLPMWRQRHLVRQMNEDVLQSLPDSIAHSRKLASLRYGTPSAPPVQITVDRAVRGPRPPTLLLAMPFLILGGAERLLSAAVAHLVQRGWRIVITTSIKPSAEDGDTTPWFERHTKEIFHLPRGIPPELWEDFLHHLVRSRAVDVVWVVGSAFAYDCLRGLRAAHPGLRVADLLFNTVGHTTNNRRRRELIDLIFVENNEVRDWLLAHNEKPSRISLVESGVDLAALRPVARSEALVNQIGAAADDLIVGFAGRWSEEKNPLGFVEMAQLIDPALPVRFVMTGTGHLRPAIEHAIQQARFPKGRFHLLGEVPEIASVLGSFDLLVVPSVLDGRPVVVLEALALGVPVVASRVGALPELIQDGSNGWLCEPNDLRAFAACVERAENRTKLRVMRRRAREYAEARLDMQKMLAAYHQGLTSLLPEDRRNG